MKLPISESYWVIENRFLAGEYPINYYAEDTPQRIAALLETGIDTFIDLTCPNELASYEQTLMEQALIRKMDVFHTRVSIVDRSLPSIHTMKSILDAIDAALDSGRKVYIHCWGGVGRTGMTVGCYLVRHGANGEQALQQIAEWWKNVPKHVRHLHSPETNEQMDFIRNWREA